MAVTLNQAEALEILEAIRPILQTAANRAVGVQRDRTMLIYNERLRAVADAFAELAFTTDDADALVTAVAP